MSEFEKAIKAAMGREMSLCLNGFGITENWKPTMKGERFERSRASLLDKEKEFFLCKEWLSAQKVITQATYNSYFLKHVVERWANVYIPNGIFIAAVWDMKIKYVYRGGHNIYPFLSKKLRLYDGVPVA